MESKYLEFKEIILHGKKTKAFELRNNRTGFYLGEIKWYGAWRQYVFFPNTTESSIFSAECLKDISDFIKKLMEQRKKRVRIE